LVLTAFSVFLLRLLLLDCNKKLISQKCGLRRLKIDFSPDIFSFECLIGGDSEVGFTLSCHPQIMRLIENEAEKAGMSRTQCINEILSQVLSTPNILTSGTCLEELQAYSRLFNDDVMLKIPAIADKERRSPDQMLLYLIELGIDKTEGST
jgi:hypothetical protein